MKLFQIVLMVLAALAVGGYLWLKFVKTPLENQPIVVSHGEAEIGGPFELVDTNGGLVSDDSLHGQYVLVYFGYTNCPDVCPIDMNRISMALNILEAEMDLAGKIQPVFITVDPARDTSEVIGSFLARYHDSFIGLTGTQVQIEKVAADYKVYIEAILASEQGHDAETGLINHSSHIYLMGPDGNYTTHFGADLPPSQLAAALTGYLEDR